jgi:tetratricopeptide (TPR) repeat protein
MTVNFAKRSLLFACLISTLSGSLKSEEPTETSLEMSRSILQAEDLLSASLFEDATQIYKEILADLETQPENEKIKSEVHYRLAQVLFQSNDYTTAINYLTEVKNNPNSSLLLGKAYRRNGLYKEAIDNLQIYLTQKDKNHADEAFFELGLTYLATENLDKSLESLSQATEITENSDLRHRAFIQIAYIYAKNKLYSKAFDSLKKAEDDLSENSALKKEIYHVKGKLFYNQKKWQEALSEFEKADSSNNALEEEWSQEHLYLLGKTFLQLAETSKTPTEQKNYFQSSAEVLKKLIKLKENEDHWLALSETLVSQNMRLEDGGASQEALFILNDQTKFENSLQKDRINLLMALAQPSYEERHNQLRLLSNKEPQTLDVWYARGINDFEAGFSLKNKDLIDESIKLFGRAGVNFKRATQIAHQERSEKALQALLMEAKSYDYSNQKQLALNVLDSFWDQPNTNIQDPVEIVILYSQIAQSKPNLAIDKLIAVENLKENALHPTAIYRLATFYYQKGDYDLSYKFFAKLLEENPSKELTPQILLSLIYSGTKLGIDKDLIKNYRKKFFKTILNRKKRLKLISQHIVTKIIYRVISMLLNISINFLRFIPNLLCSLIAIFLWG